MASQWVEQEVETALARERQQGTTILFPVRIDNTVMTLETGWPALIRNTRNIGDFRRWKTHDVYQKALTGCCGTSKPRPVHQMEGLCRRPSARQGRSVDIRPRASHVGVRQDVMRFCDNSIPYGQVPTNAAA